MPIFNRNKYEIFWNKGGEQETPVQPVSPTNDIAASPPLRDFNLRKTAAIGIGVVFVKKGIDTLRSEITASTGNEIIETDINNAFTAIGYVAAAAIGPIGIASVAADITLKTITYNRQLKRQNLQNSLEAKVKGKRVKIASGSVYYD